MRRDGVSDDAPHPTLRPHGGAVTAVDALLLLSVMGASLALRFGGAGLNWARRSFERGRLRRACVESIARLQPAPFAVARGRALPAGEPLVSPFGGRPCVAFRVVRLRRKHERGTDNNDFDRVWVVDDEAEWAPDFYLDDGTGRALVRPRGDVRFDVVTTEPDDGAFAHVEAFRRRHGHDRATFFAGFHDNVRYRETIVEVGQAVLVAGAASLAPRGGEGDERAGYRDGSRRIEIGPGDAPLYVGDGRAEK